MNYDLNKKCKMCGLHRGYGFNHKKCSKELQKLINESCEKRNNKTINHTESSKKCLKDFTDFILSTESYNEIY